MNQPTFSFRSASYRFARWFTCHSTAIYWFFVGSVFVFFSFLLVAKWWNRPDLSLTFFLDLANYLFAVIVFAVGFLGVFFNLLRIVKNADWETEYLRNRIAWIGWNGAFHMEAREAMIMGLPEMREWVLAESKQRGWPDPETFGYGRGDADMERLSKQYSNSDEPEQEESPEDFRLFFDPLTGPYSFPDSGRPLI